MKVGKALKLLWGNPLLCLKRFLAELKSLRPFPEPPFQKCIRGVLFEFDDTSKSMYYGKYEMDTVAVMRKFLRQDDIFINVGANIGWLSAVAMGFVGKTGEVHSFEPVPQYFQRLAKLAELNPDYKLVVNQYALGEKRGKLSIDLTNLPNIGWSTMVPGFMSQETIKETIEVKTCRLDEYIKEKSLDNISVIKIDVEGFEFPVLKGLSDYLEHINHRPVIICEVAPDAYPLLDYRLDDLVGYLEKYGYHAFSSVNTRKKIDIVDLKETTNVIFR